MITQGHATPPDYTPAERARIAELMLAGRLSGVCPNGHFWLRDYPWPVRRCPACGALMPWADATLAGMDQQLGATNKGGA